LARINKHHILIFYVEDAHIYVSTTPKLWAHVHPHHFPKKPEPRTWEIEEYLIENFSFNSEETDKTFVLYNFSTKIATGKNGISFYKI
jgi:hypothetical protein